MSVKVKPLVWEDFSPRCVSATSCSRMAQYNIVETLPGLFVVEFHGRPVAWGQTVDEAKAKAQAWYEQHVRECLEGEA